MDDSAVIYEGIIDVKETNFSEKNITCKTQSFYILLAYLIITKVILIFNKVNGTLKKLMEKSI